jgi:hypothetical protein
MAIDRPSREELLELDYYKLQQLLASEVHPSVSDTSAERRFIGKVA